jgi:hypothetical protein
MNRGALLKAAAIEAFKSTASAKLSKRAAPQSQAQRTLARKLPLRAGYSRRFTGNYKTDFSASQLRMITCLNLILKSQTAHKMSVRYYT